MNQLARNPKTKQLPLVTAYKAKEALASMLNPITGLKYEKFSNWSPKNKMLVLSIYPDAICVKTVKPVNTCWEIFVGNKCMTRSTSGAGSAWYEAARFKMPNQFDPSSEEVVQWIR